MKSLACAVLAALVVCADQGQAQTAPPADAPRVFLDCSYYCDVNFIRTEISWVNWVRDQADAGVHVLVTREETGGGGGRWKLNFIGLKDRQGQSDTLQFMTSTNDSEDAVRQGMVRMLKAGLVPYIMNTSLATRLQIGLTNAEKSSDEKAGAQTKARDPWNYWVFTLSGRGNLNGESQQSFRYFNGNVSANRTTEGLKLRISVSGNQNTSEFSYFTGERDTTIISESRSYNFNVLAVKTINGHWSAGFQSNANSATRSNIDLGTSIGPAIEYSIWPYSEATRRSLAFRYSAGVKRFDYSKITIFDKMEETHPNHSLTGELNLRQRWGSFSTTTNFSQYLHDRSKYNASIFANANVRLFKGFSVDFFGDYARVRDQLSLEASDLSQEEVLLQRRELETSYRYFAGFGVRYSFGSIFNNVVNPRFGEIFF